MWSKRWLILAYMTDGLICKIWHMGFFSHSRNVTVQRIQNQQIAPIKNAFWNLFFPGTVWNTILYFLYVNLLVTSFNLSHYLPRNPMWKNEGHLSIWRWPHSLLFGGLHVRHGNQRLRQETYKRARATLEITAMMNTICSTILPAGFLSFVSETIRRFERNGHANRRLSELRYYRSARGS